MIRNTPAYFPQEEKAYTVAVYKRDSRLRAGERLFKTYDLEPTTYKKAVTYVEWIKISEYPASRGFRVDLIEKN